MGRGRPKFSEPPGYDRRECRQRSADWRRGEGEILVCISEVARIVHLKDVEHPRSIAVVGEALLPEEFVMQWRHAAVSARCDPSRPVAVDVTVVHPEDRVGRRQPHLSHRATDLAMDAMVRVYTDQTLERPVSIWEDGDRIRKCLET